MPYSPGSVWPGYSVSHIPSSPWRTWVNTHAQARSASQQYVDGSDGTSRSWHKWVLSDPPPGYNCGVMPRATHSLVQGAVAVRC